MKAFIKKHYLEFLEFLAGGILSLTVAFAIKDEITMVYTIIGTVLGVLLATSPFIAFLVSIIRNPPTISFPVSESTYKSPFPEIDQNEGQSQIISSLFTSLKNNYGLDADITVDEMGKMIIGAHVQREDQTFEFVPISNLVLTPPDLDVKDEVYAISAQKILEKFEDDCKTILGENKE